LGQAQPKGAPTVFKISELDQQRIQIEARHGKDRFIWQFTGGSSTGFVQMVANDKVIQEDFWTNGSHFLGEKSGNRMNGHGYFYWADKDNSYDGLWKDNHINGYGVRVWK